MPLLGKNLSTRPLPEPTGSDLRRKVALLFWLPRYFWTILWRVARAEAVHALVPGDLGTLGLLLALLLRKPLLIRHCGTWNHRATLGDRLIAWILPRIAGGRNVVLATGGGLEAPAGAGGRVSWIFSTSLTRRQVEELGARQPWTGEEPLRLVTGGRLTKGKNAAAALAALVEVRRHYPRATLDVVGEGPEAEGLQRQAESLGLEDATRFHGNLAHHQVLEVLRSAHLFVFPTRVAEGFPKAVVEAMACGLPVLVPPVSVLPLLLEDGGGWLLEGTDPEAVAGAVLAATSDPRELARRGTAARRTAEAYTLEAWRDEIRRRLEKAWGYALVGAEE